MEENKAPKKNGGAWLWIAVAIFVVFAISAERSFSKLQNGNVRPAATAAVADGMAIDDVMASIEDQVKQKFEKYNVFLHENIIVVQVWESGMADTSYLALSNEELSTKWAEMVENMRASSENMKKAVDASGNNNYHVAYYLMNDQNDENFLTSTLDDTLMYDAVSGVNLLGIDK